MSTVEWSLGAVNCDVDVLVSSYTEHRLFLSGLMYWSITNDPRIRFE
jgi:hypothetical protein